MNPSGLVIPIRLTAQGLLRCSIRTVQRQNKTQLFILFPRQYWTLADYQHFAEASKGQTTCKTSTHHLFKSCMRTRIQSSQFLKITGLGREAGSYVLQSQRFSTSNPTFKQPQERENIKESANSHEEVIDASSDFQREQDEHLLPEQWKVLKDEWTQKTRGPKELFESRTMSRLCKSLLVKKAQSLMEFVQQERIPLTYPLMASHLYICVRQGDHQEFFMIHDWFMTNNPVLESGVLTNLISGFCQTSRWRDSLKFLQEIKKLGNPSARNYHSLISAACDHNDYALVEDLLQEMYSLGIIPSEKTCIQLLQVFHCETTDLAAYDQSAKIIYNLLWHLRAKRIYPSLAVGSEMQNWFSRKNGEEWKTAITRIDRNGRCRYCSSTVESSEISQEDFLNLRHQIVEKVIKGGDVYQKTRPDELKGFMEFVSQGVPYDVIVDGLNVARMKQTKQPSKLLRQVVVYLAQECGLKCLVLGRQHMMKPSQTWNQHHMTVIQDVADCFFMENVSEDDPFMLYATLHSGPQACYITRDMLRDHKALLDPPTHVAFIKWQRQHQMYPLAFKDGKAIFKPRIVHDTVAQYSDSTWHIPCDDGSPRYSYQVPLDWLCAKQVK